MIVIYTMWRTGDIKEIIGYVKSLYKAETIVKEFNKDVSDDAAYRYEFESIYELDVE